MFQTDGAVEQKMGEGGSTAKAKPEHHTGRQDGSRRRKRDNR